MIRTASVSGPDLAQFRTPRSWVPGQAASPGTHERGGKRLKGKTRSGNAAIRRALVEAARAAARTRIALRAQDDRLKREQMA